jgi:hypothetical protein
MQGDRDAEIELLAHPEATLQLKVAALTSQRDACRTLAQQAIHYTHALYLELTELRALHQRLLNEFRETRRPRCSRDMDVA